jgi:hypothetical protein
VREGGKRELKRTEWRKRAEGRRREKGYPGRGWSMHEHTHAHGYIHEYEGLREVGMGGGMGGRRRRKVAQCWGPVAYFILSSSLRTQRSITISPPPPPPPPPPPLPHPPLLLPLLPYICTDIRPASSIFSPVAGWIIASTTWGKQGGITGEGARGGGGGVGL